MSLTISGMNITTEKVTERDNLLAAVSMVTGIPAQDIIGKCRKREVVTARAIMCYVMRHELGYSSTEVAQLMRRTHAAVLHLCDCCEDWQRLPGYGSEQEQLQATVKLYLTNKKAVAPMSNPIIN